MRRVALALASLALLACGDAEGPHYAPPTRPHAALLLEPPVIALGEVAEVALAIVTPEGFVPEPVDAPAEVPGFWVLDTLRPDVQKQPGRWVHRTVVRIRARQVGRFEFPALSVGVAEPDGGTTTLDVAALPLEVVSVLGDGPDLRRPFGVRRLPRGAPEPAHAALAFGAGVGLTLAVFGLVWLARRRRAWRADAAPPDPPPSPPWIAARAELAAARERAGSDPLGALDAVSHTLRQYASARFGSDAAARTTEELRTSKPPFTLTTRWPALLELLARLDALRFPPPHATSLAASARELADAAGAFVEDSVPAEEREA